MSTNQKINHLKSVEPVLDTLSTEKIVLPVKEKELSLISSPSSWVLMNPEDIKVYGTTEFFDSEGDMYERITGHRSFTIDASEALKYDSDKVQLELLPPELLTAVGEILTFGAKKYAPRNWEKGMKWSRVFGALMRHMWAWWGGENLDRETGKSHLWHAGCCIAFLIAYEQRKVGEDDRVKQEQT